MEGGESSSFLLTMIERAKEELEKLETQHPNRFEYLKHELKSFISLSIHNHHHALSQHLQPTTSAATTQASTSRVKRKRPRCPVSRRRAPPEKNEKGLTKNEEKRNAKSKKKNVTGTGTSMDRVDVALEKARACIQKIQDLKAQLLIC